MLDENFLLTDDFLLKSNQVIECYIHMKLSTVNIYRYTYIHVYIP